MRNQTKVLLPKLPGAWHGLDRVAAGTSGAASEDSDFLPANKKQIRAHTGATGKV